MTAEGASPTDLALAVQLGQTFDRFLVELAATDLRAAYLAAFPISATPPTGGETPTAARLRALWQGRAIDGVAIYLASQQHPSTAVPASLSAARRAVATTAVARLASWVAEVVGPIGTADPAAWRPSTLDYAVRAFAGNPVVGNAAAVALAGAPDRNGDLAWHAFDADGGAIPTGVSAPAPTTIQRAVIPGPVRFRGMPNERFWDFEDGRVDFGALTPDQRGLASLIVMDFMLVHGNDWFLVPFELPVGSLCASALTMVDVFGQSTAIPRADANTPAWTMFSTSSASGPAGYVVLPASAAATSVDGLAVEDVRFLRDDTAAIAWGVEHATESSLGAPRLAADRAPSAATRAPASSAPLSYRLQSDVPANWIPFQPVKLASGDEVALERAALLSLSTGVPALPAPLGRVLEPTSLPADTRYRIREEQVPREGVQIVRRSRHVRGIDGSTHVWISRARSVGTGEGWSGLRFDLTVETE